jgi:multidrug efflux pump subunit AcrA (membrane-fusion protein)
MHDLLKWLGTVVGGMVLAGITPWGFRATPEVQVVSAQVTAGPIIRRVVATGTVQPLTTVEVGAQVSGIVQSLHADFNSVVRVGQVIARLGLADSRWTELISGTVHPGDVLVISAVVRQRSRL